MMLTRRQGVLLTVAALVVGCGAVETRRTTGVLDYLYPSGAAATPPRDVQLQLPVRVGLAFVPDQSPNLSFTETRKADLLQRVASAFSEREDIASVEVLPGTYLENGGGFENLDQLRAAFGIDLMVLLSYDQAQLSEANRLSVTYWTIVGAYLIEGEENETHTLLDAVVIDIPSHALLFRAAGTSRVAGSATAIDHERELRQDSEKGFDLAVDDLVVQLDAALARFAEAAPQGSVRGLGTPAISISRAAGSSGDEGGLGRAGAFGLFEAGLVGLLLGAKALGRRQTTVVLSRS